MKNFMYYLSVILSMFFLMVTFVIPREFEVISFSLFGLWSYIAFIVNEEIENNKK